MEERLHAGTGNQEIEPLLICVAVFEVENLKAIFLERNLFWKDIQMVLLPRYFSDCASSHNVKMMPLLLIHNLVMKKVVQVLVFYVL